MGYTIIDKDVSVPVGVSASLKKMKKLTKEKSFVVDALQESSDFFANLDGTKVKRLHPSPFTEIRDPEVCTVLVENLPDDHSAENIQHIFGKVGNIKKISIHNPLAGREPKKFTISEKLLSGKLYARVEYETVEVAEKAVAILNDEQDWRYGMRVKLLKQMGKHKQKKNGRKESDSETTKSAQASDLAGDGQTHNLNSRQGLKKSGMKELGSEKINSVQASDLAGDGEKHNLNKDHEESHGEEDGEHISNEKNGPGSQNRRRARKQNYCGTNGQGHETASSTHGRGVDSRLWKPDFEISKPTRVPRMPDGTRGFTMGRGRPLASNPTMDLQPQTQPQKRAALAVGHGWPLVSNPTMDSQPQTQPQKIAGKASMPSVEKATWDFTNNSIFIKFCVEQVLASNRPGTRLSSDDWNNIISKFQKETGKLYSKKQLKKHCNVLKTSWICWNNLIRGESGLERDPITGAIIASDDWWWNKVQRYPECAKFREKPLQNEDELNVLFEDVAATGEFANAPSSGAIVATTGEFANTPSSGVMPIRVMADADTPNIQFSGPGPDELNIDREYMCSSQLKGKRQNSGRRRRACPRKASGAKQLSPALNHIVDAVESSSAISKKTGGNSIVECLGILAKIPGVNVEDELYIWAARLFMRTPLRESFISLERDDLRLRFLKLEIALEKSRVPNLVLD